jgi:hypothetical protein
MSVVFNNGDYSCSDDFILDGEYYYDYNLNIVNPSCNGTSDGSVFLTLTENCMNCAIAWSTPQPITAAGSYWVSVTDTTGCLQKIDFELSDPELIITQIAKEDESACGMSDGTATAIAIGGTSPYDYLWSQNEGVEETADSLQGGLYFVTVTDANGCSNIDSVLMTEWVGEIVWIGESSSWDNIFNWDKDHAPIECENVILRSASSQPVTVTLDANYTSSIRSLTIESNVSLLTNGMLSILESNGAGLEIQTDAFITNNGSLNISQSELESILCYGHIVNNGTINVYGVDPVIKLGVNCNFDILGNGLVNVIKE